MHVVYEVGRGLLALEREARETYDVESVENNVVQGGARVFAARLLEQLLLYDAEDLERDVEHVEQRVAAQLAARLVVVVLRHAAAILVQAEIVEGHETAARKVRREERVAEKNYRSMDFQMKLIFLYS